MTVKTSIGDGSRKEWEKEMKHGKKKIGTIALATLLLMGSSLSVIAADNVPKNQNGDVYAGKTGGENKFVSADVLSVGFQATSRETVYSEGKASLRLVTTVDSLNYQNVGFQVTKTNLEGVSNTIEKQSTTVYTSIVAGDNRPGYKKTPDVFSRDSKYFATLTITNIPLDAFEHVITVTPFWTTQDGIKVYGVTRSVKVSDAYGDVRVANVPVRMNTDVDVAAGYVEVKYDKTVLKYVGYTCGANQTVFEEMAVNEVADETDETKSILRCVGNVAEITENKKADGMYINLRFEVLWSDQSKLPEAEVTVMDKNQNFCDMNETIVSVPIVEARYYSF